jgi:glyoxylase-like metal-dependent hydrolase (beta-lactamase superfamily II)
MRLLRRRAIVSQGAYAPERGPGSRRAVVAPATGSGWTEAGKMLRRALRIAALPLLAVLALAAGLLLAAHVQIRGLGAPLPRDLAALGALDLPVALRVANTASQSVPRAQVLDPARDPTPDMPYELADAAFLLTWADGRKLLIDAGMEPEAALAFGRTLEWVGAAPTRPHGSAAQQLPELASGPLAVVFTHLHTDHTQGIGALCAARRGAETLLLQTAAQAERRNHTTRPGAAQLEAAGCLKPVRLPDAPLAPLPGFPGVAVLWAAGHTPGSQVILAALRGPDGTVRRFAFAGDVANAIDGIRHDVPKPLLYRLLVVPEDDRRLGELRRFLGHLEQAGVVVVPSHDGLHLASLGLPAAAAERATPQAD